MNEIMIGPYTKEELEELTVAIINEGREYGNPKPVRLTGTPKELTLQQQIERLVRVTLAKKAVQEGFESEEEANDFEVDDDPDPITPYQVLDMVEEEPQQPVGSGPEPATSAGGSPVVPSAGSEEDTGGD